VQTEPAGEFHSSTDEPPVTILAGLAVSVTLPAEGAHTLPFQAVVPAQFVVTMVEAIETLLL